MNSKFVLFIIASLLILYFFYGSRINKNKPIESNVKSITAVDAEKEEFNEKKNINQIKKITSKAKIEILYLANSKLSLQASSQGAILKQAIVKNLNKDAKDKNDLISNNEYPKYMGVNATILGQTLDLSEIDWKPEANKEKIIFSTEIYEKVFIKKIITLNENAYTGHIKIEIQNRNDQEVIIDNLKLTWGPEKRKTKNQFNLKQAVALVGRKVERLNDQKGFIQNLINKEQSQTINLIDNIKWIALRDQYFCIIFYPLKEKIPPSQLIRQSDQELEISMIFPKKIIPEKSQADYEMEFYMGPQNYDELKKIGYETYKIIDFGLFGFISIPIYYILKYFYKITHNYGVAIILLTLLMRAVLWWPTQKSYHSMKKMQTAMSKMQPRLKTLKEIYQNNPAKLNEETMKLYKEYQINPMSGCLPMLLQLPIFFALYSTLMAAVELKGAEFIWIWKDLSSKDPMYILPLAMGISMFIQQKMSSPPAATTEAAIQQKMMLYLMPIMLTIFAFMWPSGLLIYWVVSNILSIVQQMVINRQK